MKVDPIYRPVQRKRGSQGPGVVLIMLLFQMSPFLHHYTDAIDLPSPRPSRSQCLSAACPDDTLGREGARGEYKSLQEREGGETEYSFSERGGEIDSAGLWGGGCMRERESE